MHKSAWVISAIFLGLVLGGCVTREDIRGLQTGIYNIENRIDSKLGSVKAETENVQINQADLAQEIKDLNQNIAALQESLKEEREKNQKLAGRLDDMEASITARLDSQIELLSGSKFTGQALPSSVYNLAEADFSRGRLSQAIQGFENYVKQYPKAERVPEAKLKIADAYAKQKEWTKAIAGFDEVVAEHPDHSLVPTALLRKGKVLEETGNTSAARLVYQKIVKNYQYKAEATLAQERLNYLQSPSHQK